MQIIKRILRFLIGQKGVDWLKGSVFLNRQLRQSIISDGKRLGRYSGAIHINEQYALLSRLIAAYHVVEKSLTMPAFVPGHGADAVKLLIGYIAEYEGRFGGTHPQVKYAVGCVKEYFRQNADSEKLSQSARSLIEEFIKGHAGIVNVEELTIQRAQFYSSKDMPFPIFAAARRTVRSYADRHIPYDKIKKAVSIALHTPSACNRQYCKVYCISDKDRIMKLLDIQGGARGFGHLADRLMIVVADLEGMISLWERNDVFTNGGMFLMNLCYGLYYNEVAHCILNWSKSPTDDAKMRKIVRLKPSEVVVALVACGEATDVFKVAVSPRKGLDEVLEEH